MISSKRVLENMVFALVSLAAVSCAKLGGPATAGGAGQGVSPNSCVTTSTAATAAIANAGTSIASPPSGNNVMTITVNGGGTCSNSYPNKPCVSVQVCDPTSGTTCVTINDLLLDTGSVGLRVFKSAFTSAGGNGPTVAADLYATITNSTYLECEQFGDGSSEWGPVVSTYVKLGGETGVKMPIEVIDPTYASSTLSSCPGGFGSGCTLPNVSAGSSACGSASEPPDHDPSQAGFNGILGVGLFAHDCLDGEHGQTCTQAANKGDGLYYTCNGSGSGATCQGAALSSITNAVQNPVAMLAADNNGEIIMLPSVGATGTTSTTGYLVLGIGTESSSGSEAGNSPSGSVTAYATNSVGQVTGDLAGVSMTAFLDSGSNGIFMSQWVSNLSYCADTWFCPSSTQSCSASFTGSNSKSSFVPFEVGNYDQLTSGSNMVFSDISADSGGDLLDFGFPFFLGRTIYVGIDQASTSLGYGPFWAY